MSMLNHITALQVIPDYQLQLTYDDGEIIQADFHSVINQGGVFRPLADPDFFAQACLDAHGRVVVWPGELEFCADALRLEWAARLPYQSFQAPHRANDLIANIIVVEDL